MKNLLTLTTTAILATGSQAGELTKNTQELCGQLLGGQPIKTSCENIPSITKSLRAVALPPEKHGNTEVTKYVDFHGTVVAFREKTTTR